jgi:hypothetical protein
MELSITFTIRAASSSFLWTFLATSLFARLQQHLSGAHHDGVTASVHAAPLHRLCSFARAPQETTYIDYCLTNRILLESPVSLEQETNK